jgi:hypothetical protein
MVGIYFNLLFLITTIVLALSLCDILFKILKIKVVKAAYPELTSFADAGHRLVGPKFGMFSRSAMIATLMAEAISMLITVSDGIGSIYSGGIPSNKYPRDLDG